MTIPSLLSALAFTFGVNGAAISSDRLEPDAELQQQATPTIEQRLGEARKISPHLGDMYDYRHSQVPLNIYLCDVKSTPGPPRHESLRYDYADQDFTHFSHSYLQSWVDEANRHLNYLSGSQFGLKLDEVQWKCSTQATKGGFTMLVTPLSRSELVEGVYFGRGVFFVSPRMVTLTNATSLFSTVPVHEILHGLIGPHSSDPTSTTFSFVSSYVGLTPDEADYLGWPRIEPIDLSTQRKLP